MYMWGSESSLYNIYSSAHTACWKTRNGGNVGFTRIMKNAWIPLIWELVIWAFKQWNRQIDKQKPYTQAQAHAQLNRWQKKEGFDAFNLTLCSFFYRLHLFIFCLFLYIHSFYFSSIFSESYSIVYCISHRSQLFEYFILNSQFLLLFALAFFIFRLIFTKTWNRFIGSCLAIKVPINDRKKNLNKKSITSLVLNNWCWKYICMWLITEGKTPQNQNKTKCWLIFLWPSKYMSHYFFIHWIFVIPESRIERMKRLMWSTKLNSYKYHRECPRRWRRKHSSGVNLLLASNAM